MAPIVWVLLVAPAFIPCSSRLCEFHLCQSGCGEIELGPSRGVQKVRGSRLLTLLFLSWQGKLFLAGKLLLGLEQYHLGRCSDVGKIKLFSFSSCVVILRFPPAPPPMVLLKLRKWIPGVSQSCFLLWVAVYLLIFVGGGWWRLVRCHLNKCIIVYLENRMSAIWTYVITIITITINVAKKKNLTDMVLKYTFYYLLCGCGQFHLSELQVPHLSSHTSGLL